jgi:hypothetical protein
MSKAWQIFVSSQSIQNWREYLCCEITLTTNYISNTTVIATILVSKTENR